MPVAYLNNITENERSNRISNMHLWTCLSVACKCARNWRLLCPPPAKDWSPWYYLVFQDVNQVFCRVQDLSDNDLGRHPTSSVAIGELLRANTCLQTLKLAGRFITGFFYSYRRLMPGFFQTKDNFQVKVNSRFQKLIGWPVNKKKQSCLYVLNEAYIIATSSNETLRLIHCCWY